MTLKTLTLNERKAIWLTSFKRKWAAYAEVDRLTTHAFKHDRKNKIVLCNACCIVQDSVEEVVKNIKEQGFLLFIGAHV